MLVTILRSSNRAAALAALVLVLPIVFAAAQRPAKPAHAADVEQSVRFPSTLTTIDGETVDVAALATSSKLVVVTLKATWCTVCQQQLARFVARESELRDCGVRFIVLAPGPREKLAAIRTQSGFSYPFVEDRGLDIAGRLGLRMGTDEIVPGLLLVEPDLTVSWKRLGRSAANFGEHALLERLDCAGRITI